MNDNFYEKLIAIDDLFAYHFYSSLVFCFTTVLASFIFQGRCSRENCKYLHPPPHLKTQLEINGRNNLIQQKNMAMLAQQMQLANAMMPGAPLQPVVSMLSSLSLSLWPSAPCLCRSSDYVNTGGSGHCLVFSPCEVI